MYGKIISLGNISLLYSFFSRFLYLPQSQLNGPVMVAVSSGEILFLPSFSLKGYLHCCSKLPLNWFTSVNGENHQLVAENWKQIDLFHISLMCTEISLSTLVFE